MSLSKIIEISESNITASHWFLSECKFNFSAKAIEMVFVGYKTKQDRLEGKNPVPNAVIKYTATNWAESEFDLDGVETVIQHREYNKFITPELKQIIRQQSRKHVRTLARNQELADAVDD